MKKSTFYNSVENQIAHSDKSEKKNGRQEPFCHVKNRFCGALELSSIQSKFFILIFLKGYQVFLFFKRYPFFSIQFESLTLSVPSFPHKWPLNVYRRTEHCCVQSSYGYLAATMFYFLFSTVYWKPSLSYDY